MLCFFYSKRVRSVNRPVHCVCLYSAVEVKQAAEEETQCTITVCYGLPYSVCVCTLLTCTLFIHDVHNSCAQRIHT